MKAIQKIKSNLSIIIKVLRHGILSLYSYIRKFVPWRSRTYIQNLRHVRIAGITSSFLFGLLALAIIIPLYNVTGTEDTEAASSYVPSTSSITFTSTRNKASINLTPTSTTGTFVQSDTTNTSEVASFNVTTDNATGYTLGIASSTNTTSLTNGTDTLPTITNASSGITATTFNTSTYNDMWGYLPSKYNSTANTGSSAKFYPMTTTTATLDETAAANSTANTYTIALGARVTMSKSSGTYTTPTGTAFILTAVGKPASYSITYNQNTTDTVSNLPGPTGVQSTSAQSITLSSTTPTRANYNFLGWCSASTSDLASGTNASSACTSVNGTYYAGGTTNTIFYIDETTPNVTTLYAMWESATRYMQDLTLSECKVNIGTNGNPANIGDPITVVDRRDGQIYTVRYINGGCWMTQNLRYLGDTGSSSGTMTITNNNSNVSNKSISLYSLDSSNAGNFGAYSGHCDDTNGYNYACVYDSGSTDTGVWYNYYAATAGTISTNSNNTAATKDICPAGWHLPTGPNTTSGTDINELVGNTTSNWQSATTGLTAFSAVADGWYRNGSLTNTNYGVWWYATANSTTNRYLLRYNSTNGQFRGDFNERRLFGIYVRCVMTPLPTHYSIAYDKGKATSNPSNMPSTQSGSVFATSVTLSSNIPILTGYTFTGWCLGEVTRSSTEVDSCTGTGAKTFVAGATFGIDPTSTNSVTLHAMWSKATVNVTVNFAGSGVTSVTFANDTYGNITVSTSSNTAALKYGVSYTITGTYSSGYEFSSWSATAGSLGSTTTASTTYSTTATATLTLTGRGALLFTINFGTGISGVIVKDSSPEGGIVDTITTSGGSVYVAAGSNYYLLPLYNSGYTFSNLTASGGTRTSGTYGYYYYTPVEGTSNSVTVSATTLATTSSTNMQGLTDANCTPYPMAVKDTRDSEVYYVQRLADGKCWMLENLRLDLVAKKSSLTTENTNVDSASLTSLKSGNRSAGDQYATAGVANWTSSYSYSAPLVKISDKTKTVTGYGPGRNYAGGYYNYCAASAGSYCYGDGTSYGTSSGNASYDICPAGWHMPSTTPSNNMPGSYYYLYNTAYSANASNFRTALSTPLSGEFSNGFVSYQDSIGYFWSSTRHNSLYMYSLYVVSSNAHPTYYDYPYDGYSVRCVLK